MTGRFFEDFAPGQRFESKSTTVTEKEIVDFARAFDPQPFHLDAAAAEASMFGGLVASGFHTIALSFRLIYDTGFVAGCNMGAPGMEEVQWLRPVRPGDAIRVTAEVLEVRPSASKPDRGTVRFRYTTLNQNGEAVATMTVPQILRRRG